MNHSDMWVTKPGVLDQLASLHLYLDAESGGMLLDYEPDDEVVQLKDFYSTFLSTCHQLGVTVNNRN